MKKYIILPTIIAAVLLSACSTLQKLNSTISGPGKTVQSQIWAVGPIVTTAVDYVLAQSKSPADKVAKAKIISGVGAAIYQLTDGTAPTVEQFNVAINNAVPAGVAHWSTLINALGSIYEQYYNQAGGDVKVATQLLNAIAIALQSSTAPIIAGN